jgi:quinol monooxygenase YgiN
MMRGFFINTVVGEYSIFADVLRAQDNPNMFFFYEVYKAPSDVDFHKTQEHYKAWVDFKESGGTVSAETKKADGEFIGE